MKPGTKDISIDRQGAPSNVKLPIFINKHLKQSTDYKVLLNQGSPPKNNLRQHMAMVVFSFRKS